MQNSRWGGVAHAPDSESQQKPQELSGSDSAALQVRESSDVNATGTCEKSGTRLTRPAAGLFAECSAVIADLTTWLARQTDQAIISHTLILLNSLKRNAPLAQIADNTAHWEAAVRAGR